MRFKRRNVEALADLVCGNLGSYDPAAGEDPKYFPYRSSSYITEFFQELDTDWAHDGSTRHRWVGDVLESMLSEPHDGPTHPPEVFCRLVDQLMSPADATNEGPDRPKALAHLIRYWSKKASRPSSAKIGTAISDTWARTPSPCLRRIPTAR